MAARRKARGKGPPKKGEPGWGKGHPCYVLTREMFQHASRIQSLRSGFLVVVSVFILLAKE